MVRHRRQLRLGPPHTLDRTGATQFLGSERHPPCRSDVLSGARRQGPKADMHRSRLIDQQGSDDGHRVSGPPEQVAARHQEVSPR